MADRSIVYRLQADIGNFDAKMRQAGASVKDAADRMTAANKQGREFRDGLDRLGSAAGKIGLLAAGGLGAAVIKAANFDQAMSNVKAATMETADNMGLLRQAALDAGESTVYSATEAAGAVEELAKAGVSTKDVLAGGLDGALSLAAAGELEVAEAAEIAASAMTQFALKGTDVEHIADLLAAGAGKAQGSVRDLGMALNQSGLVASQVGVSIEETTGTLAAFASAGLTGSDAGTSFKTMLLNLTPSSKKAADLMKDIGLSAYDANGEFVGMAEYAGRLQKSLEGMGDGARTAALKQMFGNDAIRAANVLYSQGEAGIAKWTANVDDAGFAAETAATKLDNLKGDWEEFTGALETALIGTGSGAQGPLRDLVQTLTEVTNAYNDLPQGAKTATAGILGVTAVAGGSIWAFSKLVTGIASTRAAMEALGFASTVTSKKMMLVKGAAFGAGGMVAGLSLMADESNKTGKAIEGVGLAAGGALMGFVAGGPIGAAIGGGIGALAGLAKALWNSDDAAASAKPNIEALASSYDVLAGSASQANREIALGQLQQIDGAIAAAQAVGVSQRDLIDASLGNEAAIKRVNQALGDMRKRADEAANSNDLGARLWSGTALSDVGRFEDALGELGITMGQVKNAALENALAVGTWKKEFPGIPKKVLTEISTEGIPQTQARVQELIKKYELTGKERKAFLRVFGDVEAGRKADTLKKKADDATKDRKARVDVDAGGAMGTIGSVNRALDGVDGRVATTRIVTEHVTNFFNRVMPGQRRAQGGPIYGPGTATSDSIPAYLSNGEYVIKAAAVEKYGTHFFDGLNAMRLAGGGKAEKGKKGPRYNLEQYVDPASREQAEKRLTLSQEHLRASIDDMSGNISDNSERLSEATSAYDAVVSKMEATGQASVAGFQTDLFDQGNVWGGGGGWFANLSKDIAGLLERGQLQQQLAGQGITGDALAAILAQGSNADISSLITSGRAGELQAMFNQRASLSASVSAQAGQYAYGAEQAVVAAEVVVLQEQNRILNDRMADLVRQNGLIEMHLRMAADGPERFADAVNGVAGKAQRVRASNPRPRGKK